MKYAFFILIIIIGVAGALAYYRSAKAPSGTDLPGVATTTDSTPSQATTTTKETPPVVLEYPSTGAKVSHSFTVKGKARGYWFFEASLPITVYDKDGSKLWQGPAQAKTDWMTTDYVQFEVAVTIPVSYHGDAVVMVAKDNPSGLPENDASIAVPVTVE